MWKVTIHSVFTRSEHGRLVIRPQSGTARVVHRDMVAHIERIRRTRRLNRSSTRVVLRTRAGRGRELARAVGVRGDGRSALECVPARECSGGERIDARGVRFLGRERLAEEGARLSHAGGEVVAAELGDVLAAVGRRALGQSLVLQRGFAAGDAADSACGAQMV